MNCDLKDESILHGFLFEWLSHWHDNKNGQVKEGQGFGVDNVSTEENKLKCKLGAVPNYMEL